jgi:hypothetical protein
MRYTLGVDLRTADEPVYTVNSTDPANGDTFVVAYYPHTEAGLSKARTMLAECKAAR